VYTVHIISVHCRVDYTIIVAALQQVRDEKLLFIVNQKSNEA